MDTTKVPTQEKNAEVPTTTSSDHGVGEMLINASGHTQELDRNFGFWSACFESLVADNAWGAGSASLVVAFYNGGAPGVLYEFLLVSVFCCCIGASLAELASAIPSSAAGYHWASVTGGPKFGRFCSWFSGWWNCLAYIFGVASVSLSSANSIVAFYMLYHPDYVPERWQIFIAFLIIQWLTCALVLFGQRILPIVFNIMGVLSLVFWFVTLMVVAIMPSTHGNGYASTAFVWRDWENLTGYSSDGFVFLAGMLNGAYALGTIDSVAHIAEEVPQPKKNIPKAIFAMLAGGIITTFVFYIALLYAITDIDAVLESSIPLLPIATIFLQATNSVPATAGLLFIFFFNLMITLPGAYVTAGRMLWTLSRDKATPFHSYLSEVSPRFRNPFLATFLCGCGVTILGCIFIGSQTAFSSFVGSFMILISMSYLAAILPHLISRRRYIRPGPFFMKGALGYTVIGIACAYIIVFDIIYMFPFFLPVTADTMNYASALFGGITILLSLGYFWQRRMGYEGPHVVMEASDDIMTGIVQPHHHHHMLGGGGSHDPEMAAKA